MLAPEPVAPDEQEPSVADIQLQEEVLYHVSISGGLPQDSKQPPNSQPVRPWSAGSRPQSALGVTRPRPTSAVRINNVAADGLHADGTDFVQQGAAAMNDRPASPGHWTLSAPRARPQSSKGRARPTSAASQQQPTSTAQQQLLQNTMHQLQEQQDAHNSRTLLQIPRLNLINLKAASKMRSASFPQQGLLQAPVHKVPEVITDLVTAANSQNDISRGYKGLGVQSASDTPAVAAAAVIDAAAVPASSPAGKRQASVITIGVSPGVSNSSNVLSDADNGQTTVNSSTTEFDGDLHDNSQQQWQLSVLGTIEEEDSVLRTQRQQQEDNLQIPRCASPVNLAADVSFDNSSYANSGQISPASPYNWQKQRPYSSSSSRRQQDSNNAAGHSNSVKHRKGGGQILHAEQQQEVSQAAIASGSKGIQQQQQEESQNASYEPSAADHSFYGALASNNYQPKIRPWSAAATNAARKLYGAPTMQLAGPAQQQQQQQQQQRRCGSAHPYYSIDTRLMTRSAGVFSPNVSLAASRGAGFHVHTTRHNSSSSRSTLPPRHSSSRSAAAAAAAARAAAAASLSSSLSASRCCSRQQQQSQQQSRSGSSHRYSDLSGDSVDLDLAGGDLAGSGETLDEHNADDLYHERQQLQEQQLVNEVSLQSSDNASEVSAAAAEQRDEVLQQQQRSRSTVSQMTTGRDSPTSAGQISYRLPASRPVSAAAAVAAKQRSNQQARLATAKAARDLNARPRSDHSATARGGMGGGVGGSTAAAAAAAGAGRGLRGVYTGIGQIVVSSSRRGSSRWQ